MNKAAIKERFIKKIYRELQDYKAYVMEQEADNICGEAYKIEILSTFYEILLEKADSFSDVLLLNLVNQSTSILERLYQDWLKKDDSSYREMQRHVDSEMEETDWWNKEG
jgi:hypothetical protein